MLKPLVVVTGKNGQLGWELQQQSVHANAYEFLFIDSDDLDLAQPATIPAFFEKHKPSFFISCAAYTAVDKAETEKELAYTINATSPRVIAEQCAQCGCTLIQVSTDYVFNGNGTEPYRADAATEPVNYYGFTKAEGEKHALAANPGTIIIRTSWLYSSHGNNFVKTMLRLMKERTGIKVVNDQLGSPTYAADLAELIITIIDSVNSGNAVKNSIYQFSNAGVISWFDFATAIRDDANLPCEILPIPSSAYPTPAKRPAYSVMDTGAVSKDFGIQLKDWRTSLRKCLQLLAESKG
ncbi:dTDP-4-dehydrorhamnose reductase [Sediminibacterium roseum]|uniref:dTDP-4-dehydrorhamnose reductase n=1 Tax=Sediminibacterium roseum TaxID=1978412 RepID=A0ABW9ZV11_9BACT|nr:dTDP-4-dehydrorhamnose reductase [Sediminibacterium roseum]NCI50986.1 dTDP-4-dehydrorhamnose reductase [Sediminibacterium roseum]